MRHYPKTLSALCLLFTLTAAAQRANPGQGAASGSGVTNVGATIAGASMHGSEGGASLLVSVFDDGKIHLDRQAAVKLYDESRKASLWQATSDTSETIFGDLGFGKYEIEVSAVGYLTGRKEIEILSMLQPTRVEIVLNRDPAAVELNDAGAPLPPKASKETKRGIADLKSGKLQDAQKQLDAAYKIAPSNARVNFLLGYLAFQQQNLDQAQTYLSKAAKLDPQDVQALNLLGRLQLVRKDYAAAQATLEQAVAADPESWTAHNFLADAYLNRSDYQNALAQADIAIDKGRSGAGTAQIVRGEALADLGRNQEGIETLQTYLQSAPDSPSAPQVRQLIARLEERVSGAVSATKEPAQASGTKEQDPLLAASQPTLSSQGWAPAGIDEVRPPVAAGVACPYQEVIEKSGERVKQLVDNVAQFSAIEDLTHERLDAAGNPTSKEVRKFDYVAAISEQKSGVLAVDEFRTGHYGVDDLPDQIVTNGFPALALVFHPDMRDNFEMTCEGLGSLHGQATWLVHFLQREDKPMSLQAYIVGNDEYLVKMKGRAWISADSFQIVRIESELASTIPKIQLMTEHQIAEYGPVLFAKKKVELWLPKSAEIYLDWHKHRYYRRHSFDHFMLFSTDSTDKVREAKGTHGPDSIYPRKGKKRHA
jgi:tetratricopeptide (TPR) repeat protein